MQQTIAALEQAGATVRYLVCDVTNADAVDSALADVRAAWGPIEGLVHGAGVIADKRLAQKSLDDFERVFQTKVIGLKKPARRHGKRPSRAAVRLFVGGRPWLAISAKADYAMANETISRVLAAVARKRPQCRVRSLAWGPWEAGMVTPVLRRHFERIGVPLISLAAGADALCAEALTDRENVEVGLGSLLTPSAGVLSSVTTSAPDKAQQLDVLVDASSLPHLTGHRIEDVPVLPVVCVLEWFARAAGLCRPDLVVKGCKDLRVLQGIRLEGYGETTNALTVSCRQIKNGDGSEMALELLDDEGRARYRARVALDATRAVAGQTGSAAELGAEHYQETWPYDVDAVYKDKLFHHGNFAVIQALDGISDQGAAITLSATEAMGWPAEKWLTDPATLDGGLQLAILWGDRMLGKPSLPTRLGTYHRYHDTPLSGPIRCTLKGRVVGSSSTISDIAFTDQQGSVVAELRDVELYASAAATQADR
jgi:hypothetical protein